MVLIASVPDLCILATFMQYTAILWLYKWQFSDEKV